MRGKEGSQERVREGEEKMNGEGRVDEGLGENGTVPDRSYDGTPVDQDALRQELVKSKEQLKVGMTTCAIFLYDIIMTSPSCNSNFQHQCLNILSFPPSLRCVISPARTMRGR